MSVFDKEKTVTDMEFVDLLEAGIALRQAKFQIMYTTDTMQAYNEAYFWWKKEFRGRYSEKYLERSGFLPNTAGVRFDYDEVALLDYIQLADSRAEAILDVNLEIADAEYVCRDYLQRNGYNWDNKTNLLYHNDITYTIFEPAFGVDAEGKEDASALILTFYMNALDVSPLIINATNIFALQTTLGVYYTRGVRKEVRSIAGPDVTVQKDHPVTITGSGSITGGEIDAYEWKHLDGEVLASTAEFIFTPDAVGTTTLVLEVKDNFGNIDIDIMDVIATYNAPEPLPPQEEDDSHEWYLYTELKSTIPEGLGVEVPLVMTAIIPIKENDVFSKDTLQLKRFLNKLGLGGGTLIDSLTEDEEGEPSEVDNAYIIEGLRFDKNDEDGHLAMALYKSFKYLSGGSNKSNFSVAEFDMSYSFKSNEQALIGQATVPQFDELGEPLPDRILTKGEYYSVIRAHEDVPPPPCEPSHPDWPLCEQYQPWQHPGQLEQANNSTLTIYWQETDTIYKKLTIYNYEQSFTISGYSFKAYLDSEPEEGRLIIPLEVLNELTFKEFVTIHEHSFELFVYAKKTYTIKWYQRGFFRFLFTLFLTWLFAPAGALLSSVLIDAVINFAIAYAISTVAGVIDNEFLALIMTIGLILFQAHFGGFDLADFTVENYLPLANKLVDAASDIFSAHIAREMDKVKQTREEQEKEEKEWEEEMQGSGINVTKAMMDAHFSYLAANGPDAYIRQMLGEGLYNFEQFYDVTGQIELRKNVVAG